MLNRGSIWKFALAVMMAAPATGRAQDNRPGTDAVLKALTVEKQVRVHKNGKEIRYALDGSTDKAGDKLVDGQVFVTRQVIKVTYQELNPLETVVNVKVKAVENAASADIAKLVEALSGLPSTLKPELKEGESTSQVRAMLAGELSMSPAARSVQCDTEIGRALAVVDRLDKRLYSQSTTAEAISEKYDGWRKAISNAFNDNRQIDGAGAVGKGITAIKTDEDALKNALDLATRDLDDVDRNAAQTAGPGETCRRYEIAVYQFIRLTNPRTRLGQLRTLQKTIGELRANLQKNFADSKQWLDRNYIAALDVTVSDTMDADISVEARDISVDAADAALAIKQGDPANGMFVVQFDTGWAVEVGVGVTAGFVARPKFGTAKDADGNTIVARVEDEEVSIDPTVMLNFIPRTGTSLLRPMVQIGASTSTEAPAIFMGGGWRLFGPKDGGFSFGAGLMLAWVKTLDKLEEGDPVEGTAAIEEDLKFDIKPKPRFYVTLQYRF